MIYPKLKIRPTSQQSVAQFHGIWHNPAAPIGYWYDARNLSSDLSPNAIARRARRTMMTIDGNNPDAPIAAMVGGDHLVLLDQRGRVWCNGHYVDLGIATRTIYHWRFTPEPMEGHVNVKPGEGSDTSSEALGGLVTVNDVTRVLRYDAGDENFRLDGVGVEYDQYERTIGGTTYTIWSLTDYGIEIWSDVIPEDGYTITLQTWSESTVTHDGWQMVRMGAYVYIMDYPATFVNAVKLASGETMVAGVDYGSMDGHLFNSSGIDMEMCDIDGLPYSGIVVSATEPAGDGYWLDISDEQRPALREWSASASMWVQISSTFVKVGPFTRGLGASEIPIRRWDTVQITPGEDAGAAAKALLNGAHYIYNLIEEGGDVYLVLAGILDDEIVSDPDAAPWVTRSTPSLDFVVEAGNRLWGCRYSEEDQINEIYASKLGDPANWEVFQGLSTDSWRASRGTAAPFTGAAVLDGHPLFFRETSLEKVYPSASGAHQIQTFDLEGVEQGAADSLVVIEDRLYYKSPGGIMVYTGSLPRRISGAFEGMAFRGGTAARHGRKYCISTRRVDTDAGAYRNELMVLIYDLDSGDWQIEDEGWNGRAVTWQDDLYYIDDHGAIKSMAAANGYGIVNWWAETAPQAIHYNNATQSLTEHKWISYLRIRFRMLDNGSLHRSNLLRIYISYEDGPWELKRQFSAEQTRLQTWELNFLPRRKDNFRLRLEGFGPVQIYDIAWRMERSQGGH